MLVLTRKATETIKIGDNVVIKIICTGTKSVRIGIEAPDNVRILRGELQEFPAAEEVVLPFEVFPIVADAVADVEPSVPVAVPAPAAAGPLPVKKFGHEFNDILPGRSIRRMLDAKKHALKSAAK